MAIHKGGRKAINVIELEHQNDANVIDNYESHIAVFWFSALSWRGLLWRRGSIIRSSGWRHKFQLSHHHLLKARCQWLPGHLLSPPSSSTFRQRSSKDWKEEAQRRASISLLVRKTDFCQTWPCFFPQRQSLWSFRHVLFGCLFAGYHLEEIYNIK